MDFSKRAEIWLAAPESVKGRETGRARLKNIRRVEEALLMHLDINKIQEE